MSGVPLGAHIRKSDTPGPGKYESAHRPRSPSNEKHGSYMFVGSSKQKPGRASQTSAGPGTYTLPGAMVDDLLATKNPRLPGFASSVPRTFGSNERDRSPGPGVYEALERDTLAARALKSFNTAAGGKASFGSTSARNVSKTNTAAGDPGAYGGGIT